MILGSTLDMGLGPFFHTVNLVVQSLPLEYFTTKINSLPVILEIISFIFHDEDLLIMVVVWLANHFYYNGENGELFSCLLYSSLEAIILPPA